MLHVGFILAAIVPRAAVVSIHDLCVWCVFYIRCWNCGHHIIDVYVSYIAHVGVFTRIALNRMKCRLT